MKEIDIVGTLKPGITGTAQIFVHDKEWKACGAEMEDIGVGDALIVISCHGNRSE
jgi:membrane protein implicated in regulation of membrane protease activity